MADLPDQGSPASVEDRIGSLFDSEPESDAPEAAPETASDEGVSAEAEGDETDGDEAPPPQADVVEVEDGQGNKHLIPAALKDQFAHKQDYTRKTQQAATLSKAAEDRMQFAEAKEQVLTAIMQDYAGLQEKQARLAQLNGLDLGALYNADPGQVFSIQQQIRTLEREVADGQRTLQGKAQHIESSLKQHREKQWTLAVEGVKQALGTVSQQDDTAMLKQVQELGFSTEELKGRFADPRFLMAVFKAAKWDQLQSGKSSAIKSAASAPPVLKPGVTGQGNSAFAERMQFKKSMKAAKSDSQKAVLIGERLANKFRF
jgi:hypothetical protein